MVMSRGHVPWSSAVCCSESSPHGRAPLPILPSPPNCQPDAWLTARGRRHALAARRLQVDGRWGAWAAAHHHRVERAKHVVHRAHDLLVHAREEEGQEVLLAAAQRVQRQRGQRVAALRRARLKGWSFERAEKTGVGSASLVRGSHKAGRKLVALHEKADVLKVLTKRWRQAQRA